MTIPTVTERDAAGAMELLASASEDPELLIVLTDEEIVALAGRDTLSFTGSPYLDQESVDEAAHASAALRSLIARGLVVTVDEAMENEGETVIGEAQDRALQIDRPLAGLLMLRSTATAVVHVTRQVAEQMTRLVLHVEADGECWRSSSRPTASIASPCRRRGRPSNAWRASSTRTGSPARRAGPGHRPDRRAGCGRGRARRDARGHPHPLGPHRGRRDRGDAGHDLRDQRRRVRDGHP